MEPLAFNADLLTRQPPRGMDVDTALAHFAIITCLVDPDVARRHLHSRFELDLISVDGREWALVSVVPFVDQDFRFARIPRLKWRFGQTNYRMYVTVTAGRSTATRLEKDHAKADIFVDGTIQDSILLRQLQKGTIEGSCQSVIGTIHHKAR